MKIKTLFGFCLLSYISLFANNPKTIQVVATGDIMLGTAFPSTKYLPKNVTQLLAPVQHHLQNADITFGNLEGCLSDSGLPAKLIKDSTRAYLFRMPTFYARQIADAGFDLLSIANNHARDFGEVGLLSTKKILDSLSIAVAGTKEYPFAIIKRKGLKIGFCAFAPNKGTLYINNYRLLKKTVKILCQKTDIVIVSFHGGAEGKNHQHISDSTEYYLGENRGNIKKFARIAIDAGADLILGHGPHVPRTIDFYKKRFIIYSLGNFCTYGRFNLRGVNGIAPLLKLELKANGEFIKGEIIPIRQYGRGLPRIDKKKLVIKNMQKLLKTDAPNCGLTITNSGIIKKNKSN